MSRRKVKVKSRNDQLGIMGYGVREMRVGLAQSTQGGRSWWQRNREESNSELEIVYSNKTSFLIHCGDILLNNRSGQIVGEWCYGAALIVKWKQYILLCSCNIKFKKLPMTERVMRSKVTSQKWCKKSFIAKV